MGWSEISDFAVEGEINALHTLQKLITPSEGDTLSYREFALRAGFVKEQDYEMLFDPNSSMTDKERWKFCYEHDIAPTATTFFKVKRETDNLLTFSLDVWKNNFGWHFLKILENRQDGLTIYISIFDELVFYDDPGGETPVWTNDTQGKHFPAFEVYQGKKYPVTDENQGDVAFSKTFGTKEQAEAYLSEHFPDDPTAGVIRIRRN